MYGTKPPLLAIIVSVRYEIASLYKRFEDLEKVESHHEEM